MDDSILNTIKKMLGIPAEANHFDLDIITCINSVFMTLRQLGVGKEESFVIYDDSSTWEDFLGDTTNLESVKTYVYFQVRMMFDPPQSSFVLDAMRNQASEMEWRLNLEVDPQEVVKRDEIP